MSILDVAHLSHSYGGREIFEDVSFRLEKGEHVALVGANGEGKSTFMSIITGKLSPDDGKITWARRTKVGYMDQHAALEAGKTIRETLRTAFQDLVDEEKEMLAAYDKMASASPDELERLMADTAEIQERLEAADYYNLDTKIEEVAAGLGLRDIGLDHKVDELSGGQRTKVLLTKLLLQHPDILLLDEPTNYLDAEHIEWLTRYLQNYENAFIVISHDVPFLNAVTNVIWHVDNLGLTRYTANYEKFEEMVAIKRRQLDAAYERQQAEIKKEVQGRPGAFSFCPCRHKPCPRVSRSPDKTGGPQDRAGRKDCHPWDERPWEIDPVKDLAWHDSAHCRNRGTRGICFRRLF